VAPPLADDFFRLAHDDVTGRPRLHPRAVGLGLAAALLAELVFARRVTAANGHLAVLDTSPPPDPLAHTVLGQLAAGPERHEIRTWLGFLARTATEDVATRLWRAGHVRPETARRLLGRAHVTYIPTDANTAVWPWARLSTRLFAQQPLEATDAFLVCLTVATELAQYLLRGIPAASREYVAHLQVSAPPPLRELLVHTAAAVADAVLSYRT